MKDIKIYLLLLITYFNYTFIFKKIYLVHFTLIYIISIVIIFLNYKTIIRLMKLSLRYHFANIFLLYTFILSWAFLYPVILNTYDFSYLNILLSIVRHLIKGMALLVLFIRVHKEEATFDLFVKYLIISSTIYVGFTVLFYLLPGFKSIWMNLIYDTERNIRLANQANYIMRYGLVGFSGFQQTFMMSTSSMFNIYLIIRLNNNRENWWKWALTLLILFLGNMFYGRVGLLTTIMGIIFLVLYLSCKNIKNLIKLSALFIFVSYLFMYLYRNIVELQNWFNWAFAAFINYRKFGSFGTGSSAHMFNDMYFKISQKTLLFGDGYYTDPISNSYYMRTDVGFMRAILFYGIIFTILGYLILVNVLLGIKKSMREIHIKEGNILLLLLLGTTIIFELKGEIYYKMIGIIIPFYFALIYEIYLSKIKE